MVSTNSSEKIKSFDVRFFRTHGYLWLPFVLALFFRWNGVIQNSIWYDEALTVYLTRQPLFEMVRLLTTELNPPLWEIMEWFVVQILPPHEYSYRLLSFLSAIGIWILAFKILTFYQIHKVHQFLALCIIAVLPYQVWMAQDARVYAWMSLLYLLGFWYVINRKWLGFFACCGLLLYANSAALFYFFSLLLIGVLFHPQNRIRIFLIGAGVMVLFSPWILGSLLNNLSGQYFAGYNIPPVNAQRFLIQVGALFLIGGDNFPLASNLIRFMGILFIFALFVEMFVKKVFNLIFHKNYSVSIPLVTFFLFATLPLVLITAAAWLYNNGHLILYRSFSGISVPLILFIAIRLSPMVRFSSILLTVFFIVYACIYYFWSPQIKGGYLREAIVNYQIENRSSTVIFHATATSLLPFEYYLNDASHYLLDAKLPAGFLSQPLQQSFGLQKVLPQEIPSDFFWVVWAKDHHLPPQVQEQMAVLVKNTVPLGVIDYPQAARIEIYKIAREN